MSTLLGVTTHKALIAFNVTSVKLITNINKSYHFIAEKVLLICNEIVMFLYIKIQEPDKCVKPLLSKVF